MEGTTFSYTLEFEDWLAFNEHHIQHWPYARRSRMLIRILFPVVFLFLSLPFLLSGDLFSFLLMVVIALVWYFSLPWFFGFSTRRRLKKLIAGGKNMWLGKHEVSFSSETFSSKNETSEGRYNWKAVEKIDVTNDYIFIYVTPVSAVVIPRQSISGNITFEELARLAQEYFRASEAK